MRALLLALLLVAVGLAVFSWRASVAVPNSRPLETDAPNTDPGRTQGAQAARGAVRVPPIRSKAELPAGIPKASPDPAIEDRIPTLVEDPTFATQYAGWSTAKLEERVNALEPTFLAEVDRLCDQRFEAGLYRIVDAAEVEGLDDSYDVLSEVDKQGVVTRSRSVARDLPGGDSTGNGSTDAGFEYQIVTLPPEVFPELYRQRAELDWLRATLAARNAVGEDPK